MEKDLQSMIENDTSEMDGKHLTFWMDKQLFGLPIAYVVQIIGMQEITEVPEFPFYAKGIINLRGAIIPLIDARLRLGKAEAAYGEHTCIIVTSMEERNVGVIVDEVDAVIAIEEEQIAPPPRLAGSSDGYITGVAKLEGRVVLLMDIGKILSEDKLGVPAGAGVC